MSVQIVTTVICNPPRRWFSRAASVADIEFAISLSRASFGSLDRGALFGALAAEREQRRRDRGEQREGAGAQKNLRRVHAEPQEPAAEHRRGDASQASNAERPADTARAHARRVELAGRRIGAGLAAD